MNNPFSYHLIASHALWLVFIALSLLPTMGLAQGEPSVGAEAAEGSPVVKESATPVPTISTCTGYVAPDQKADATELTLRGVACFEAQDYSRALIFYLRALEHADSPMLRAAIGRALHELGVYSVAGDYYTRYLSDVPGDDAAARRIQDRLTELHTQIDEEAAPVHITSTPSGATAYLVLPNGDWFELGQTPVTTTLKTGDYEFVVHSEDHHFRRVKVSASSAATEYRVDEELVHLSADFDVSSRQWRRSGSWMMITSAPVLATGITLLALSSQKSRQAREYSIEDTGHSAAERRDLFDSANSYNNWGLIASAIGTTGLISGALVYTIGGREPRPSTTSEPDVPGETEITVRPFLDPTQWGVRVQW